MGICTYFDRHGLSIQDARIHTTRQGWALDSFIVLLPEHDRDYRSMAALIEHELRAALAGGRAGAGDAPAPRPGSRRSRAFPIMPSVTLQPDEQGGNWRLSVTAADRVGLLRDLARVFARHDVGLKMAKIMTLGDRVEDIFVLDGPGLEHPRGQMKFERQVLEALGAAADSSLTLSSTDLDSITMTLTRSDRLLRLISLLCLAAVGVALISQHVFGMRPCAWCVLQRLILLAIAAVCGLAGMGWGPVLVRRTGAAVTAVLAVCGIAAAWYQHSVASQLFSCAQTFADRFVSASGLDAALPWLFGIYATCMDARVDLLGVEYALWGLVLFIVCAALSLAALWMSPDADQSPAD